MCLPPLSPVTYCCCYILVKIMSSKRKYKRASNFVCPHCGLSFVSQEGLSEHAYETLATTKDSACLRSLFKCEYCGELWPNEDSLSRHMLFNAKCRKFQNINDDMTKLLPGLVHHDESTYVNLDQTKKMRSKTYHACGQVPPPPVVHANIMGMEMSLKETSQNKTNKVSQYSHDQYAHQTSKGFLSQAIESSKVYTLTKSEIDETISAQREEYHDDLTASAAQFCSTLLSMCPGFQNGAFKGTLKDCIIQLNNTSTKKAMESGYESLPGFEQSFHFSDLTDEIITLFVLKHNQSSLSERENSMPPETEDDGQVDTESVGTSHQDLEAIDFTAEMSGFEDNEDAEADHRENTRRVIDETMHLHQKSVNETRDNSIFDTSELAMIELLNILEDSGAPVYLFDRLTSWCKRSSNAFQNERLVSRQSFLRTLSLKLYGKHMSDALKPKVVSHTLPSRKKIDVTAFSFKAKLASILLDKDLMQDNNLLLDVDDPFSPPDAELEFLDDLNTGWWWRETWMEICKADDEILCPIIFFIDGGRATKRVSVEPLTFTIGLFKRDVRSSGKAWRTLGYMENIRHSEEDDEEECLDVKSVASKLNEYHSMLKLLLEDFKVMQGEGGGMKWDLMLGGQKHTVVLKFAVQVILGDCKGNNMLCGQYGGHSIQSKRLCRDCMVSPNDADNPDHLCTFISSEDVKEKTKKELNLMSIHKIDNAFKGIYFGARTSSIFNCTPPEPLHGLLLGTVKYLFEEFERAIPNATMEMINAYACMICGYRRHELYNDMPSFSPFQNGITNCDSLTANHQFARIFLIFISLHDTNIMRSLCLQKRSKRVQDKDDSSKFRFEDMDPIGHEEGVKWFNLIQQTLCFYKWLMKEKHSRSMLEGGRNLRRGPSNEAVALRSIRKYMHSYKHLIGNRPGHGLKITKFHQLLHYPRQILKDGSIKNVDTGVCEGMAVWMYKRQVKKTQRKETTLNRELANRDMEALVIHQAQNELTRIMSASCHDVPTGNKITVLNEGGLLRGTKFFLSFPKHPQDPIEVAWASKTRGICFPSNLTLMLTQRLFLNTSDGGCLMHHNVVHGFTEYVAANGESFRAHPNYRGKGPWNDWCLVDWEGIDEYVPAKMITFIDLRHCQFMTEEDQEVLSEWIQRVCGGDVVEPLSDSGRSDYLKKGKWVVVRSGMVGDELRLFEEENGMDVNNSMLPFKCNTDISQRFRMEAEYKILPLSSVRGRAYCVPLGKESEGEYIHIKASEAWASYFLQD